MRCFHSSVRHPGYRSCGRPGVPDPHRTPKFPLPTWRLNLMRVGAVALPLWLDDNLTGATREQTIKVLWVIMVIAAIPWRHAFRQFVLASSERWR
jgi:hypothetical protein